MHYLKSLPLTLCSPPVHSESQKAKGHSHNGDEEVLHLPPAHTSNPTKHTHTQADKHTQLPLTYHHCPHTVHPCKAANTQNMRTLVFFSQPSLNSFPCILQLACHSSPPALSVSLSQTS